ncbi:MAG: DUF4340 domain-containing protein [Pseudomonadota bacterium]|jgi:hypothetical protein
MNTRKTLLLALLLGASVLYLTKVFLPERERQQEQGKVFVGLQESQMTRIDVISRALVGEVEQYSIVRNVTATSDTSNPTKSSWTMPDIRGAVLDTKIIEQFVKTLLELPVEDPLSERQLLADLSVYGLDKPPLTIVVHKGTEDLVEVAFGKKNEYLSKRYAKVSGRPGVFLVPDGLFMTLNKGRSEVRSKNPVQFDVTDVREVLLTSSQGRIKLSQPAVGEWKIVEPRALPASREAIESLLNSLRGVTVSEFVEAGSDELGRYGFNTPRVNVHLHMREGLEPSQVVFSLANAGAKSGGQEELYLQVSGVDSIYKLAADPSPSLVKQLNDLRDREIVGLTASMIENVVSSGAEVVPTTIAASGLLWTVNGKESDPVFVEQYLKDLAGLKADGFPEGVPADAFEPPFLQLTVTTKGEEKKTFILTIGKQFVGAGSEQMRYVKGSNSETVFGIREVEAKRLVPHEEALSAKVTPTPKP